MSLCERVMVLTRFDAVLKQVPLQQVSCSHVRVLDDSGVLSYCDSLLKPTRCTMVCHCGIRKMCNHSLFSPILLLYQPFSCPSGHAYSQGTPRDWRHQLRNPEAIHKTVITRKVRRCTCSMHLPPAPPASAHAIRSWLGPQLPGTIQTWTWCFCSLLPSLVPCIPSPSGSSTNPDPRIDGRRHEPGTRRPSSRDTPDGAPPRPPLVGRATWPRPDAFHPVFLSCVCLLIVLATSRSWRWWFGIKLSLVLRQVVTNLPGI